MSTLESTTMNTPVGTLTLIASGIGLRAVLWPKERPGRVNIEHIPRLEGNENRILDEAIAQLTAYFDGGLTTFNLPLDPVGTPFQLQAWEILRTIAYGETITYGEQARCLGDPNKARAVGAANGRNPLSIVVPCHRVIGNNGALTGFGGGLNSKSWLLNHEGSVPALVLD